VTWLWSGVPLRSGTVPTGKLVLFGLPLAGIALMRRTVQNMDLWFITRLLPSYNQAGYYGLAQYISRALMMLPVAVSGAVFPTLTQAISQADEARYRQLIRQSFRFTLIIMVAAIAVLASSMRELIVLVFGADFALATSPALYLMFAALLFAMEFIAKTVLVSAGKPTLCLAAFAPVVPINILLNYVLVTRYEMIGASLATTATAALAAAILSALVWREFRALLAPLTVLRTLLSGGLIYLTGIYLPATGWLTLLKCVGLAVSYGLILTLMGELRKDDLTPLVFWRSG